jgi:peptidoglycan/LPS O-acetylase OafA/YrhL
MAFVVFIPRMLQTGSQWPQIWHSLYFCFSRIIFLLGLTMVILSSLLGIKTSFFRILLDTSLFNIIAKISFCVYLVHFIVLSQYLGNFKVDLYFNELDRFVVHCSIVVLSCFFGYLLAVVVEIPCSYLQKDFFGGFSGKKEV